MDNRWLQNKTNIAYISRLDLLSTNDECTVIHLWYVAPSALGLLQSNHVKSDTLCSSEKGMQVSVCGDCSRVANTPPETVSMASRACVALVQNQRCLEQPEICLGGQGPVYREQAENMLELQKDFSPN
ncbi:hypothetical protein RB195_024174 [Necator americanus]|uniref:Uncharacterized protein n=1 Tax=Necator americanus TaxID=51031 RepID=A0ABR1EN05_NECAM